MLTLKAASRALFPSSMSAADDPPRDIMVRSDSPLNRRLACTLKSVDEFGINDEPSGKETPLFLSNRTTLLLPFLQWSPTPRVLQLNAVLAPQPRPTPIPLFIPFATSKPTPLLKLTSAAPWCPTGSDGPLMPPSAILNPSLVAFRAATCMLLGLKTPLVGFNLKRTLVKLNPLPFPVLTAVVPPLQNR